MELPDPKKWFLTGFAALVAPWQDQISSIDLISAYYQPTVQVVAALSGVLIGTAALSAYQRHAKQRNRDRLLRSTMLLVVVLAVCLTLSFTVGSVWQPAETGTIALRVLWPLLYVLLNSALAVCIALTLLVFWKAK